MFCGWLFGVVGKLSLDMECIVGEFVDFLEDYLTENDIFVEDQLKNYAK